jgi:hypothetical protein
LTITAEVVEADKDIYVSNQKQNKMALTAGAKLTGENKINVPEKNTLFLKLTNYLDLSASNAQFLINRLSFDKKFIIFPDYGTYIVRVQQAPKSFKNLHSSIQFKISNIIITVTSGVLALEFQGSKLKVVSINSNSSYSIIESEGVLSTNKLESLTWLEFDVFKSIKTQEGVMTSLPDTKNKLAVLNLTPKQFSYFENWTDPNKAEEPASTSPATGTKPKTATVTVLQTTAGSIPTPPPPAQPKPAYVCLLNKTGVLMLNPAVRCTAINCNIEIKEELAPCAKKVPGTLKGFYIADTKGPFCLDTNDQGTCMKLDLKENTTNAIELGAIKFDTMDSVMLNLNGSYTTTRSELLLIPGSYLFRFKKVVKDPETGETGSLIKEKRVDIEAGKLQTISN